jgi:Tol biopolymer transport system component
MRRLALVALLLSLAVTGCRRGSDEQVQAKLETIPELREEKIAYEGGLGIYVANPDATGARRLTDDLERGDGAPAWSPDGRRIAFVGERRRPPEVVSPPAEEIYVMNADGSDERRLTRNSAHDGSPRWLPDGRIVFLSCPPREEGFPACSLVAIGADGTGREELARLGFAVALDVSPDGQMVVYAELEGQSHYQHFELYVMSPDGTDRRRLTNDDTGDGSPAWSPDGEKLAFVSNRAESAPCFTHDCTGSTNELYVMDADGGDITRLTETPHEEGGAISWSPDGTRIVYSRFLEGASEHEVFVVNADGSCPTKLPLEPWSTMIDWYGPAPSEGGLSDTVRPFVDALRRVGC